ncbi:ammonium transporter [Streptomonospora nanhaiensis]|uniref:Ammonium transporter n=1 Tax=Streptomonospora nanhaiensis TaxID=1323731 RepID=A0A853BQU3_9ACTN|nr:ammonium transporter [Streptomonospora nanhaiensis]MBV2362574.1 ammonium transporter [Streptomonospora nanhaiensis]MBX9386854.1 ammonium transporter [Streptomonospora nanhaiensis]NYI98079.1 Amt family ammonium transporter [Streptomonospora nanhaiensis]
MDGIDSGTTAWLLISSALVMLMTPGLAFFYGGMSRAKSVLNMMLMSFASIAIVSVLWVLIGYSLAYDTAGPFIGGFGLAGVTGLISSVDGGIPVLLDVAFQMMFAVITVALISGAIADRAKFGAWLLFVPVWSILVYSPVAYWVWGDGWIGSLEIGGYGVIDFAGGTAVHINAGAAALALTFVLGRRKGFGSESMRPHNLPFVLLGAALLWFGWFGFNAGSAYAADGAAALAFLNTQVATAAATGAWMLVERIRYGKATALGFASGAVAGLVAITPAAADLTPLGAIALGLVAGAVCAYAISWKYKFKYDDALDVVGVHLVGGILGSLLIGLLAASSANGSAGLFYGGSPALLAVQAIAVAGVLVYSFVVTFVIAKIIDLVMGFRIPEHVETNGLDAELHSETAYAFDELDEIEGGELSSPTPPGEEVASPQARPTASA